MAKVRWEGFGDFEQRTYGATLALMQEVQDMMWKEIHKEAPIDSGQLKAGIEKTPIRNVGLAKFLSEIVIDQDKVPYWAAVVFGWADEIKVEATGKRFKFPIGGAERILPYIILPPREPDDFPQRGFKEVEKMAPPEVMRRFTIRMSVK